MQQSSATPSLHLWGLRKIVACSQSSSQCLLVSTVFGTVSSLHPTSFLMIFTLVYTPATSVSLEVADGGHLRVNLLPNPSHLEAVNPVTVGKARARLLSLGGGEGYCNGGQGEGEGNGNKVCMHRVEGYLCIKDVFHVHVYSGNTFLFPKDSSRTTSPKLSVQCVHYSEVPLR